MRQEFLAELERALPVVAAAARMQPVEIPELARARDNAASVLRRHRHFREGVQR